MNEQNENTQENFPTNTRAEDYVESSEGEAVEQQVGPPSEEEVKLGGAAKPSSTISETTHQRGVQAPTEETGQSAEAIFVHKARLWGEEFEKMLKDPGVFVMTTSFLAIGEVP